MHDYNTIIGVIGLRNEKISYPIIRQRYGIVHSGIDLIMNRYNASGLSWEDLLRLEPSEVMVQIYYQGIKQELRYGLKSSAYDLFIS